VLLCAADISLRSSLKKLSEITLFPIELNFSAKRLDKPILLEYTDISEGYKYSENCVTSRSVK
jgi:hypothetical protein